MIFRLICALLLLGATSLSSAQVRIPMFVFSERFLEERPAPYVKWDSLIKELDYLGFNARDHVFSNVYQQKTSFRFCNLNFEQALPYVRELKRTRTVLCGIFDGFVTEYAISDLTLPVSEHARQSLKAVELESNALIKDPTIVIETPVVQDGVMYFAGYNTESKFRLEAAIFFAENAKTRRLGIRLGVFMYGLYENPAHRERTVSILKRRIADHRDRLQTHTTVPKVEPAPISWE